MDTPLYSKYRVANSSKALTCRARAGCVGIHIILIVVCCLCLSSPGCAGRGAQAPAPRNDLIEHGPFIHIPGPNPILKQGPQDAWDGGAIEVSEIFKDGDTYYLYYHGISNNKKDWPNNYRLGVATAAGPLGPWKKYKGNPILDIGPEGTWDDKWVACAAVLKEAGDKYYMWYSGNFQTGLATASNPLGPWKKYEKNPVYSREKRSYVGSVFKVNGKYYMYDLYPVGESSPDQGPICLNIADKPEGPWTEYGGNPVIPAGEWGAWDDGGFSEAGVLYHDGVFHCFYSGTKWMKLESIAYAYSFDGFNWTKYSGNPIVPRANSPRTSAFAEVHAFWEPPFHYVYNTLRYIDTGLKVEHIGVEVLTTQRPFSLKMPVLNLASLGSGRTTGLADCPAIGLSSITRLALTVRCTYSEQAKNGIRIHVVASADGMAYDTNDLFTLETAFKAGRMVQKSFDLNTSVRFIKVMVENPDKSETVTNLKINLSLGS